MTKNDLEEKGKYLKGKYLQHVLTIVQFNKKKKGDTSISSLLSPVLLPENTSEN